MGYLHIDNLYKNIDILQFKECYAMEKIHGCVQGKTKINMYNGTKKEISKINKGDYVLGLDKFNNVVSSKVLNVFHNGINTDWYNVTGTRFAVGRGGNGIFSINCTGEHNFFVKNKNKYIKARDLKQNDIVLCLKSDKSLSYLQEQVLLGILLGDGSYSENTISGCISWSHVKRHKKYIKYIESCLKGIVNPKKQNKISGYGSEMITQHTYNNFFIKDKFKSFIQNNKKIVPNWVSKELTPISLAFLYMDDGSLIHDSGQEDRVSFAVCNFTINDCKNIQKGFSKLGINTSITTYNNYNRIVIDATNSIKFFLLITPYVCRDMSYKIPKQYHYLLNNKLNNDIIKRNNCITTQKITNIKKIKSKQGFMKHDLETETHNYFANDILVHNSSAHITWQGDTKNLIFFSGGEKYDTFVKLFDDNKLRHTFIDKFGDKSVTIFGEAYGGKQQGMSETYGKEPKFIVFDVKVENTWLCVPDAEKVAKSFGLEFVDYHKVPATIEALNKERDLPSTQAKRNGIVEDKLREGIVVRPLMELRKSNGDRIIVKHKGDAFKETRTKREVDPKQLKILEDAKEIAIEWVTPMRLNHVLDKLGNPNDISDTGKVIKAMISDVFREAKGEIIESKIVEKAIGKETAIQYKKLISKI